MLPAISRDCNVGGMRLWDYLRIILSVWVMLGVVIRRRYRPCGRTLRVRSVRGADIEPLYIALPCWLNTVMVALCWLSDVYNETLPFEGLGIILNGCVSGIFSMPTSKLRALLKSGIPYPRLLAGLSARLPHARTLSQSW